MAIREAVITPRKKHKMNMFTFRVQFTNFCDFDEFFAGFSSSSDEEDPAAESEAEEEEFGTFFRFILSS